MSGTGNLNVFLSSHAQHLFGFTRCPINPPFVSLSEFPQSKFLVEMSADSEYAVQGRVTFMYGYQATP